MDLAQEQRTPGWRRAEVWVGQPFGLAVAVERDPNDESRISSTRISLIDGHAFAGFIETIEPGQIDNFNIHDEEDPRWHFRRALQTALLDSYTHAKSDIRDNETQGGEYAESTKQLLAAGPAIADALKDCKWPHNEADVRVVDTLRALPTYIEGGIAASYLELKGTNVLNDDTRHGPTAWLMEGGPLDDHLIDIWRSLAIVADGANQRNPALASTWPSQVRLHYEATVGYLEGRGRLVEMLQLEDAVGPFMAA